MKKIFALIISFTIIYTALSAKNFFSGRFFEVKTGASFGFSNNLITGNDIFKKELEIDLRKLADDCPKDGMDLLMNVGPSLEVNLNILRFHLGLTTGAEMYGRFNVGKGLFDFAGYGNKLGETLNMNFTADTDAFAYSQLDVGLDLKKFKLHVKPAVFLPVMSTRGNGGTISVTNNPNDPDGNLIDAKVNVNMDMFCPVDMKNPQNLAREVTVNGNVLSSPLFSGYGFDLGGYVAIPFSKSFSLDFDVRIPLAAGHIYKKTTVTAEYEYKAKNLNELSNKDNLTQKDPEFSASEDTEFSIHRPLKASVYLDKNLLGTLFNARAGGGIGIQRPFSSEAIFYPEYYLGFTLNLIDFFKLGVSTQYRDRVFIHQVGTTLSIRFVQLDLGLSAQSSSFKKSFEVAGVGGYAYVTVGF